MRRTLLCASLALAGCRSCAEQKASAPAAVDAAVDAAASETTHDAATATADAALPRPERLVELLHWVPAVVAVSSRVDNPRDYPQHLVDGDPATAWNGKSGDLVGGWLAFVVPPEVRVRRIELSAGFDKVGKQGDLFTMNHRITKVAVERREGTESAPSWRRVREVSLDPTVRTPQAIEIDEPGGAFRIEVLEVTPGTKTDWRELVVSELRVFGLARAHRLPKARMPDMVIAPSRDLLGLEPTLPVAKADDAGVPSFDDLPTLGGRTAAEVCATWTNRITPFFVSEYTPDKYPGPPDPPHCTIGGPLYPKLVPSGGLKALREVTISGPYGRERRFAIETERGIVVPRGSHLLSDPYEHGIHGEYLVTVLGARVDGDTVVVRAVHTYRDAHWCVGDPGSWSNQKQTTFEARCPIVGDEPCVRIETDYRCTDTSGTAVDCDSIQ